MGPEDWLHYLGLPSAPAEVIDADLATVTAAADRVIRVEGAEPYVVHIEFESGRDARWMARRLFRYNALIDGLLDLPVYSVVVLLNPNASRHADLTGLYERALPNHGRYITFKYSAIRVWEQPVSQLLTGGLATLPLVLLSDLSGHEPAEVVASLRERITREAKTEEQKNTLWSATYILAGLRFPESVATQLLKGVLRMEESSTYQAILAEGRVEGVVLGRAEEARSIIEIIGTQRFGEPNTDTRAALYAVADVERLERMATQMLTVNSWEELMRL